MASVQEVYGTNYNVEACYQRLNYSAKVLSANISELSFKIRHDSEYMWQGNNMKPEATKLLVEKVQNMNPSFIMTHVDKRSKEINMFPYLIDGEVEYFRIVDLRKCRIYLIYITPFNIEPF